VGVPREAGQGVAKITIHFPDWRESKITPAMFAVDLAAPMGKLKAAKPWKGERP
jgi:hypothetical protein